MNSAGDMINTTRDVDAVLIPLGTPVTIPEGSQVRITQELGGSFTVAVGGNLARIDGKDADALGLSGEEVTASEERPKTADGPVSSEELWNVLKNCYDPEIPVNIVDLGLIYQCDIVKTAEGGNCVELVMTLTAPGCGMGPFIVEDVRQKILSVTNVTDVQVEMVFDPPWDRSMMSDEAKLQLGMF
jgi:probable FeS assembly SUF system protein SufT